MRGLTGAATTARIGPMSHARAGRRAALFLVLLHLIVGQAFVAALPAWESPDEPWHLAYAEALAAGRLPGAAETYEYHHPPLYYLWPALGLQALGVQALTRAPDNPRFPFAAAAYLHPANAPEDAPMRFLRTLSGLLGCPAVLLAWAAAARAGRGRSAAAWRAFLAGGLVACLPMFAALGHSVSNDGLATLAGAALLYASLRWLDDVAAGCGLRAEAARAIGLGAALAVAAMSKLNALVLAAALPPVMVLGARVASQRIGAPRALARGVLAAAIVVAPSLLVLALLERWLPSVPEALRESLVGRGIDRQAALSSPAQLLVQSAQMLDHVWGRYGWFNVWVPDWMRRAADCVALLGLAGLPLAWRRAAARERRALVVAGLFASLALAAGVRNLMSDPQPQARLLFPGLAAAALLLSSGLEAWSAGLPRRWRAPVLGLPLLGLIGLGLFATQQRLPAAYAASRRPPRSLDTRMLPPSWGIALRLDASDPRAVQRLTPYRAGVTRVEVPVIVAGGPGRLQLRLLADRGSATDGEDAVALAEADWPLVTLGRPDVARPRIGPLADASWIGLDFPPQPAGRSLRLELTLRGEGWAWLPGAVDGDAYPEGELTGDGASGSDLIFVSYVQR